MEYSHKKYITIWHCFLNNIHDFMAPLFSFSLRPCAFFCIYHPFCNCPIRFILSRHIDFRPSLPKICDFIFQASVCTAANTRLTHLKSPGHDPVERMKELPLCVVSHRLVTHVCPFSPPPVHTSLVLHLISIEMVFTRTLQCNESAQRVDGRENVEIKYCGLIIYQHFLIP